MYITDNLIPRPPIAPLFSRLSHHGLRHMSIECLHFGTITMPCLDHAENIFGLALLLDQLEL